MELARQEPQRSWRRDLVDSDDEHDGLRESVNFQRRHERWSGAPSPEAHSSDSSEMPEPVFLPSLAYRPPPLYPRAGLPSDDSENVADDENSSQSDDSWVRVNRPRTSRSTSQLSPPEERDSSPEPLFTQRERRWYSEEEDDDDEVDMEVMDEDLAVLDAIPMPMPSRAAGAESGTSPGGIPGALGRFFGR